MIIDTHVHVLKGIYGDDLGNVIKRTKDEGILALNIPLGVSTSIETIEIYKEHKHLLPVVGIHPDFINRFKEEDLKAIDDMITDDVVAIGEIGIDYHRVQENKDLQRHIFVEQIKIAKKHNLPVIIHMLDAFDDFYDVVKDYTDVKFLMHCWAGTPEQTQKLIDLSDNIYFAFGGEITTQAPENARSWEKPDNMRESIKIIDINRVVIETDCPGLIPEPMRSKGDEMNYPWYIKIIAEYVANHLEMDMEEFIETSNNNAKRFFNI